MWNTPSKHTIILDTAGENVVEQYSNAIETIETEHAKIHSGQGYQLSGELAALGAGNSYYFLIDPSSHIHWRYYSILADGAPIEVELFENPTTTANGTSLTPLNRNRVSTNTSSASIYTSPTVTADGSRLYLSRILGTGTGANTTGELEELPVEWILNSGNTYVLKTTNNDSSAVDLTYQFFWYEL